MHYKEIVQRVTATFVAGTVSTPVAVALVHMPWVKAQVFAGIVSVVNLAGRLAIKWLAAHPE